MSVVVPTTGQANWDVPLDLALTTLQTDRLAGDVAEAAARDAAILAHDVSPALTGNPTAPTQTPGDSSTKLATTAFSAAAIAAQHVLDNGSFAAKAGDTFTGKLTVTKTAADTTGSLLINVPSQQTTIGQLIIVPGDGAVVAGQRVGLQVQTSSDPAGDGTVGIAIDNQGNSDGMYIGCGNSGTGTTPLGIGMDIKKAGKGIYLKKWGGATGPYLMLLDALATSSGGPVLQINQAGTGEMINLSLATGGTQSFIKAYNGASLNFEVQSSGTVVAAGAVYCAEPAWTAFRNATSATGGAATALPAQPVGYLIASLNGTDRRIPYYS